MAYMDHFEVIRYGKLGLRTSEYWLSERAHADALAAGQVVMSEQTCGIEVPNAGHVVCRMKLERRIKVSRFRLVLKIRSERKATAI